MVETARLEEMSLRRLLETAATEGRRLMKALELAEAARDEALVQGRGAGGEAEGLRESLRRERGEKEALERGTTAEIASKVGFGIVFVVAVGVDGIVWCSRWCCVLFVGCGAVTTVLLLVLLWVGR